jgi:WD40 repeat protein
VRSLHLSADTSTLVSAGSEDARGRVIVWDLQGRRPRTIIELGKPAYSVRLAPDGRWVATSARDGHVRVFDAGDGRLLHDSDVGTIDTLNLTLLGDHQLVSFHSAGRTIVWNTRDWSRRADTGLFELGWSGAPIPGRSAVMIGTWSGGLATLESSGVARPMPSPHTQMISDVVVEPLPTPLLPEQERRLVAISASTDGLLGLTDVESRATLATLPVDSQGLTAAAVAGGGRCLLTTHIDGTIGIVDTPRIEALARSNLDEDLVRPVDRGRR